MEALKEYGLPSYEYGDRDFERDQEAIIKFRETVGR